MNTDEIKALLSSVGLDGGWKDSKEGVHTHPLLEDKRVLLEGVERLLQLQLDQDQERVAQLRERIVRLRAVQNG